MLRFVFVNDGPRLRRHIPQIREDVELLFFVLTALCMTLEPPMFRFVVFDPAAVYFNLEHGLFAGKEITMDRFISTPRCQFCLRSLGCNLRWVEL